MANDYKKSNKLVITIIICSTLAVLASISSWLYVSQQQIAQKDRELQQQKALSEFEQSQINERAKDNRDCPPSVNSNGIPSYSAYACEQGR